MRKVLILITCFFCVWCVLGITLAQKESYTFDELVHVKAGNLYNQGIYDFDPIEPPLVRQLDVSLAGLIPGYPYRTVIVVINGLLFGVLIFVLAQESFVSGALFSLLILLEPSILAYGHYVITDMVSAILLTLGLYYLVTDKWKSKNGWWLMILFLGLAASTKVSSLVLMGPLLVWKATIWGKRKTFIVGLGIAIIIWATYEFRFDHPARQISLTLPWGGYLRAIKENIQFAMRGQPIYFLGNIYTKGPWFKQPLVLMLKASLPVLALFFIVLKTNPKTKIFLPIILVGLLINIFSSLHFGIRHMLPILITIVLIVSMIKLPRKILVLSVLVIVFWQISNLAPVWPQPITFANELALGQETRIFSDSDFDWGQGLIQLKQEIDERHLSDYQLAYFGNIDPKPLLGDYIRVRDINPVTTMPISELNVHKPIIISETCYYMCGYYRQPNFSINKAEVLAHSFLYFHD